MEGDDVAGDGVALVGLVLLNEEVVVSRESIGLEDMPDEDDRLVRRISEKVLGTLNWEVEAFQDCTEVLAIGAVLLAERERDEDSVVLTDDVVSCDVVAVGTSFLALLMGAAVDVELAREDADNVADAESV